MFFQNFYQMLVLVEIYINGVEKIEVIPSDPGNLTEQILAILFSVV